MRTWQYLPALFMPGFPSPKVMLFSLSRGRYSHKHIDIESMGRAAAHEVQRVLPEPSFSPARDFVIS